MKLKRQTPTAMDRVAAHLQAGHMESATEIAQALGMHRGTAFIAAADLVKCGRAQSTTRPCAHASREERVFAACEQAAPNLPPGIVPRAIASQPAIALVWRAVVGVDVTDLRVAA